MINMPSVFDGSAVVFVWGRFGQRLCPSSTSLPLATQCQASPTHYQTCDCIIRATSMTARQGRAICSRNGGVAPHLWHICDGPQGRAICSRNGGVAPHLWHICDGPQGRAICSRMESRRRALRTGDSSQPSSALRLRERPYSCTLAGGVHGDVVAPRGVRIRSPRATNRIALRATGTVVEVPYPDGYTIIWLTNIKKSMFLNHSLWAMFSSYNYYICTVFFMVLDLRLITKGKS